MSNMEGMYPYNTDAQTRANSSDRGKSLTFATGDSQFPFFVDDVDAEIRRAKEDRVKAKGQLVRIKRYG